MIEASPKSLLFAFRVTGKGGRSRDGFTWPESGWVEAPGPCIPSDDPCPAHVGDGICAALSWDGGVYTGYTAARLLVIGYRPQDVLAEADSKIRLRRAYVVSCVNLCGADLSYTDLSYANLSGAYLSGADLSYANLSGANLSYTDLRDANLSGADLCGADLCGADLSRTLR